MKHTNVAARSSQMIALSQDELTHTEGGFLPALIMIGATLAALLKYLASHPEVVESYFAGPIASENVGNGNIVYPV